MNAIHFGAATDTGCVRDHNEDSIGVFPELGLFIVADGMGGHQGGEVASALVVEAIAEAARSGATIAEAVGNAHQAVLAAGRDGHGVQGMGATVVALRMAAADYEIAWVGDSRAYCWNGRLRQLTRDHSYVQRMIDAGALTEEEAREHPDRSVITQALGAEDLEAVAVEVVTGRLSPGQKILLCSDGLTSMLDDTSLAALLSKPDNDQALTEGLVQAANDAGGEDNVSVVLVSAAPQGEFAGNRATQPMAALDSEHSVQMDTPKRRMLWVFLLVMVFAAVAAGAAWLLLETEDAAKPSNGQGPPSTLRPLKTPSMGGSNADLKGLERQTSASSVENIETVGVEDQSAVLDGNAENAGAGDRRQGTALPIESVEEEGAGVSNESLGGDPAMEANPDGQPDSAGQPRQVKEKKTKGSQS